MADSTVFWFWAVFVSLLVLALWAFATRTPWGLT